jgi:trigger factor
LKTIRKSDQTRRSSKVVDLALERLYNQTFKLVGTPLLKVNENFDWSAEELF